MSEPSLEDRKKLRRRLSRLGVKKPDRVDSSISPNKSGTSQRLGEPINTPHGQAFVIEQRFPVDHTHGHRALGEYFGYEASLAAQVARDASLVGLDLSRLLFVDTETTGLVGGAGTIAFLIGMGAFEENEFILRQFFLHEPAEEAAMLHQLQTHLDAASGFISFNGRVFDLPLMEMRFRMGLRTRLPITTWPHLDLLFPARRLWKRVLPDCSLGTLENRILGVERSGEDVPGEWIPGIYLDYLRTGELSEIQRVIYHNMVDILSLVGLSVEILSRFESDSDLALSGAEALGVARWHESDGREDLASDAFLSAIEADDDAVKVDALRYWTAHLKRTDQRDKAIEYWRQWHELAPDDPRPCVELAKYYEWHAKDFNEALVWAQSALVCLSHWPKGWRRDQFWEEIKHRIARIEKKRTSQ